MKAQCHLVLLIAIYLNELHTHSHTQRVMKIINPCLGIGADIAQRVE